MCTDHYLVQLHVFSTLLVEWFSFGLYQIYTINLEIHSLTSVLGSFFLLRFKISDKIRLNKDLNKVRLNLRYLKFKISKIKKNNFYFTEIRKCCIF